MEKKSGLMSFHPHTQRAFFEEYTFTQKMDQDRGPGEKRDRVDVTLRRFTRENQSRDD
jgi:hypothetical protein